MPPYGDELKGSVSDLINSPSGGMAGAITAALFLKEFIGQTKNWVHFDTYCWNKSTRPAAPAGGEVMPIRSIFHFIKKRYGGEAF